MKSFITVWNRFSWLIPLCEDCTKAGLEVHLIDNQSTYEPCIEWLKKCPYKVISMNGNYGPWAFFTSDLWKEYKDRYIFISDSDYSFSGVPSDFVQVLMKGLEYNKDGVWKVGLSAEINDLPDNKFANYIKNYESGFWNYQIIPGFYRADIDTGPAIYDRSRRGGCGLGQPGWYSALRSDRPYTVKHLDWYLTPDNLRDEDKFYLKTSGKKHHGWTWVYKDYFNTEYND